MRRHTRSPTMASASSQRSPKEKAKPIDLDIDETCSHIHETGAQLSNRTVDLLLTITTAPCTVRTECTDDTENALIALAELELSGAPCHEPCHAGRAVFRYAYVGERGSQDRPPTGPPAMGSPGPRAPMPGPSAESVIHLAIGRRQVTTTDCNEQLVTGLLQSAQIAEYLRPIQQWSTRCASPRCPDRAAMHGSS
jgi:hypothetical protein